MMYDVGFYFYFLFYFSFSIFVETITAYKRIQSPTLRRYEIYFATSWFGYGVPGFIAAKRLEGVAFVKRNRLFCFLSFLWEGG